MAQLTARQEAAKTLVASRKSQDRAALILGLVDSLSTEKREASMRGTIERLCFEIESSQKMVRQRDDYIQELRGD